MRGLLIIFAVLAGIMIVQGYARTEQITGGSYLARVDKVYVETDPGVFVRAAAAVRTPSQPLWVDVNFLEPLQDGRTTATAKVPADLRVQPNDLVMLRFAPAGFPQAEPVHHEVSAVVSKPQLIFVP